MAVNDLTSDEPSRLLIDNVSDRRIFGDNFQEAPMDPMDPNGARRLIAKPTAGEDRLSIIEGGTLVAPHSRLLDNDHDPDPFDAMSILSIDRTPTVGRVTYNGRSVIYDATGFERLALGETDVDAFRYEVGARGSSSSFGTVRVTVIGENDAPIAAPDSERATAGVLANIINVLRNDDDVDSDDDRGTLRVVEASATSGAAVNIIAGSEVSYDAFLAPWLGAGETALDTITYTIEDRHGARATSEVRVTVSGVNDAPMAADDRASATEDAHALVAALANDIDPDRNDHPGVVAIDGVAAAVGQAVRLASGAEVTVNADGTLTYDPRASFDRLALGATATDTFRYTIADGHAAFSDAAVTVVIDGRNDAPVTAPDIAAAGEDATSVSIDALANDDDADTDDDPTSLRIVGAQAASGATVAFDGQPDGHLIYQPFGHFDDLSEGESAPDTITYTVEDRHGAHTQGTVTIRIEGVNDAPTAGSDVRGVTEDTPTTMAVLGNDTDPDRSDRLRILAVDGSVLVPGGQLLLASGASVALDGAGAIRYDPNGSFDDLALGQHATDSFRYTVGDDHGGTAEAIAAVDIVGRNDSPIAGDDAAGAREDGPVIEINALANDDDVDADDDRGSLRIVAAHAASGANVTFMGRPGEGLLYDPSGRHQALGEGETATDLVTYTVEDRHGARSTGAITIAVTGTNDAPKAVSDELMITADAVLHLPGPAILANDRDPDSRDALRITAVNGSTTDLGAAVVLASGALLTVNPDGSMAYDPNGVFDALGENDRAIDSFAYTIADGHGGSDSASVTVTVLGRNDPPTATADRTTTDQDSAVRVAVLNNDTDPDADALDLRVLALDTTGTRGTARINADGTLTYDPSGRFASLRPGETATDTFHYLLDDTAGDRSTGTVTVTVVGVERATASHQQLLQSFEVGPFPDQSWNLLGSGRTLAGTGGGTGVGFGPTHGSAMAHLEGSSISANEIEAFLSGDVTSGGRPLIRLPADSVGGSAAHSGSAVRSVLSVGANDVVGGRLTLAFDWNFLSGEEHPELSNLNDFAVFTVTDGTTARVFKLAEARETTGAPSGWRTSVFDIGSVFSLPAVGDLRLTLGFAVLEDETPANPSRLLLDNVRLERPLSADHELVRSDASGILTTFRERPQANDDAISMSAGAPLGEDRAISFGLDEFLANDRPSAGAAAASLRLIAVDQAGAIGRRGPVQHGHRLRSARSSGLSGRGPNRGGRLHLSYRRRQWRHRRSPRDSHRARRERCAHGLGRQCFGAGERRSGGHRRPRQR